MARRGAGGGGRRAYWSARHSWRPGSGYTLNLLMQAVTYAIAVAGIVVVLGYCGQISLTQAGFFGIGAYATAIGVVDYHIPFLGAWIGGVLVAGAMGLLLGFASLRLGGHYLAMVTISFQQILTLVLTNWIGFTHGPDGISGIARPSGLTSGDGVPQPVPGGDGRRPRCTPGG